MTTLENYKGEIKKYIVAKDIYGYLTFIRDNYSELNELGLVEKLNQPAINNEQAWKHSFDKYATKALKAKKEKNLSKEKEYLILSINNGIALPYYFERMAIILTKEQAYTDAVKVLEAYFQFSYWTDLKFLDQSIKLFERKTKLEKKLKSLHS